MFVSSHAHFHFTITVHSRTTGFQDELSNKRHVKFIVVAIAYMAGCRTKYELGGSLA